MSGDPVWIPPKNPGKNPPPKNRPGIRLLRIVLMRVSVVIKNRIKNHQESSRIIRNHQESLRTFKNPNGIHQLDPSIHFLPLSMIKCTVRYPKNPTKLSRILNEGQESPNSPQHQLNLIHFVPRIPKNLQESR